MKFTEPSLGRVITAPEVRGVGQGRILVNVGLARCLAVWPGLSVRISAQLHLQNWYSQFGFVAAGEPYGEDNIPHIEMLKAP